MWIFSTLGFVSIVEVQKPKRYALRFRDREVAERYHAKAKDVAESACMLGESGRSVSPIYDTKDSRDYRFRFFVALGVLPPLVAELAAAIDYDNFKDAAERAESTPARAEDVHRMLSDVWSITRRYQGRGLGFRLADVPEIPRPELRDAIHPKKSRRRKAAR